LTTDIPRETLLAMLNDYERALRQLLHDADENARLFQHRRSSESLTPSTPADADVAMIHEGVRRVVVGALHQYHPEIPIKLKI
jgi:hypothetical protein